MTLALSRLLESLLYQVSPTDASAILATLLLIAVALGGRMPLAPTGDRPRACEGIAPAGGTEGLMTSILSTRRRLAGTIICDDVKLLGEEAQP